MSPPRLFVPVAVVTALVASAALAEPPQTVCTVTINSADERDAMQRGLSPERHRFVELVQPGRPDWFAAACRSNLRCDVLVISGHFAGTEFYSSRPAANETLEVADMRGELCSESCPGVFENLKEVYLFGCDTLKVEPTRSATPEIVRSLVAGGTPRADADSFARALSVRHAEASRERVRRLFPRVPVIYGFASLAPLGRVAGPMLERYLEAGGSQEVGTGRASASLLALFGPSSMVATTGVADDEPGARESAAECRAYDARLDRDTRVEAMHALLAGPANEVRMAFDRLESFFATQPRSSAAVARIAADSAAATNYLALARATHDPALRLRMLALARTVGWLDEAREKAERLALAHDVIRDSDMDYGEVDLVCGLAGEGSPGLVARFPWPFPAMTAPQAAALACLGDVGARRQAVQALASEEERDVRAAQAYLRHRPISDAQQLRAVVASIAAMRAGPAQVRALEAVARLHVADSGTLQAVAALFARTPSAEVQRAIAEIFLRAARSGYEAARVLALFRAHRLPTQPDGQDLVDQLLRQLASPA